MTKQEIQKFANRTKQIRGRRLASHILHRVASGGDWWRVSGYDYYASDDEEEDYDDDELGVGFEAVDHDARMRTASRPRPLQRCNTAPASSSSGSHGNYHRLANSIRGTSQSPSRLTHPLLTLLETALTHILFPNTEERYEEEREARRAERHGSTTGGSSTHRSHRSDRDRDRANRDEYIDENSEDEFKPRAPKMLEAPASTAGSAAIAASAGDAADFVRERDGRRRERERDDGGSVYVSGGLGRREEGYGERER